MSAETRKKERPRRRVHVVINPISGRGDAVLDLADMRKALGPEVYLDVLPTKSDVQARDQVLEIVESLQGSDASAESDAFVAAGGDGTVSEVAAALFGTGFPLGVVARGTANAFARGLGIPLDLKGACEVIAGGKTRTVDAARGSKGPMVLISEIGLGARMIAEAERAEKKRLGSLAYLMAGARQLADQDPFLARLQMDDHSMEIELTSLTVANVAPWVSALAHGCGEVVPDDGKLEVTLIVGTDLGLSEIASLLASAVGSFESGRENILCHRTSRLRVETDPPITVVIDGEDRGETPFDLECLPRALEVFVP